MEQTSAKQILTAKLLWTKPPRIALFLLAVNVTVHLLAGPEASLRFRCLPCGASLIALGFSIMIWAWWLFRRKGTAICPTSKASTLVQEGIYRVTRNPMYMGITMMLLGSTFLLGTVVSLFAPAAFLAVMNYVFVPFEEDRLVASFGNSYLLYRERVRRWI
jgi:protein-S-isoprenylcysteine O-methyltransferase Ste14